MRIRPRNDDPDTARAMAALLREAVEEAGFTQGMFAALVGSSESYVSQVFTGAKTAHPKTLDRWAFIAGRRFIVSLRRHT